MSTRNSRRTFLKAAAAGAAALALPSLHSPEAAAAGELPTSPVGIGRCHRYDFETVKASLASLFDRIGGVATLVRGRTVSVKVNLTGGWNATVFSLPPVYTVYTHPVVVLAACVLFRDFGARRIVICESLYTTREPRTSFSDCGYDVAAFGAAVPTLEWEDTHNVGSGGGYRQVKVAGSPFLYSSFQLNHRYVDTDVVVSIAKMKNHQIAGVTLGMKNLFGSTPSALYSSDRPDEQTTSARVAVLHEGGLCAAGGEILPIPSRSPGYRVPRVIVDVVRARPIDLVIIDGITSMDGGEGAWHDKRVGVVAPALLIAGRNPVCTDAVAAAVMGYDPMAPDGAKPFYNGANHLRMAAECGLGSARVEDIEVLGLDIAAARYAYQPTYRQTETPEQ